jgi:hypothetical protein
MFSAKAADATSRNRATAAKPEEIRATEVTSASRTKKRSLRRKHHAANWDPPKMAGDFVQTGDGVVQASEVSQNGVQSQAMAVEF